MSATATALMVLACVLAGGAVGVFFNATLPGHHLTAESRDSVKQTVGVLSTLTALVLGLLIGTAKSSYDAKTDGLTQVAVDIVLLDRAMSQYGPETAAARKFLRDSTTAKLTEIWQSEGLQVSGVLRAGTADPLEALQASLRALAPQTNAQRDLQSRALTISSDLVRTRWLFVAHAGGSIPLPFLTVLVVWLALTFAGLGLVAPRNATVMAAGLAAAAAVAGAMFLILELDTPYHGVIAISDAPLRLALEYLGR